MIVYMFKDLIRNNHIEKLIWITPFLAFRYIEKSFLSKRFLEFWFSKLAIVLYKKPSFCTP